MDLDSGHRGWTGSWNSSGRAACTVVGRSRSTTTAVLASCRTDLASITVNSPRLDESNSDQLTPARRNARTTHADDRVLCSTPRTIIDQLLNDRGGVLRHSQLGHLRGDAQASRHCCGAASGKIGTILSAAYAVSSWPVGRAAFLSHRLVAHPLAITVDSANLVDQRDEIGLVEIALVELRRAVDDVAQEGVPRVP